LEYDLLGRQAVFYKSGAAPTYVMRDGGFFKLRARTLPMGILQGADVQTISLTVGAGDLIVMMSDGVTQGREESPRLFDLLHSHVSSDIDRLADLVLKYAKEEDGSDDISVLVIKIEEDI
jgi:stage II sporulation protein E